MRKIFTILLFCLTLPTEDLTAQYNINESVFSLDPPIAPEEDLRNSLIFQGHGDYIYAVRIEDSNDLVNYNVIRIGLSDKHVSGLGGIKGVQPIHFTDIAADEKAVAVIGNGKLLYYNYESHEQYFYDRVRGFEFDRGMFINDSLLLLYGVENFHPFDGEAGLYLNVYNVRRRSMVKSIRRPFPGAPFSFLTVDWVTKIGNRIYAFSPLSAKVFVFNLQLEGVDTLIFPYELSGFEQAIAFEQKVDSSDAVLRKKILEGTMPPDEFQSKNQLTDMIDSIRKNYHFVEKVYPMDDSIIVVTLSRPTYGYRFRDVVFYNPKTNRVIKEYKRWPCAFKDTLVDKEDFFVLDLINDAPFGAYFHGTNIYFGWFYDPLLFKPGKLEDFQQSLFNISRKKGYAWNLVKYSYAY